VPNKGAILRQWGQNSAWLGPDFISGLTEDAVGISAIEALACIGVAAILVGAVFIALGLDQPVNLRPSVWIFLIIMTTGLSILMKDYVMTWSPLRIHREPNHLNMVFKWKSDQGS
jgi:hypothetical protein